MEKTESKIYRNGMVHFILVHSYMVFLFAIILGVFFDTFLKKKMFSSVLYDKVGFLMLLISTIIIYWAQKTSSNYQQRTTKDNSRSNFEFGPYRYLRSPTHFGLFIMALGFSLIVNSFFSIVFTFIAYGFTKLFFLKKEEKMLEQKYGQVYSDYKKKVRNWI